MNTPPPTTAIKISRLTLWRVSLTSHETYYMADGKTCDTVDSIVIRIDTNAGLSGFGEVCPIPHYLPAYAGGVIPAVGDMAAKMLGANPIGADSIMTLLNAHLLGHSYAKSAVDIALWDITAQAANLPLYALLGGRQTTNLPLYHSITCIAPGDMATIAKQAQAEGITQFQVKLSAANDWRADVERLIQVREAVGASALVYGDWNCGASALHAIRVGRAVRNLDIMLEQPCNTLEECAAVRAATGLPMKMDEGVYDIDSLMRARQLGCMDAAAIKLSKFGGIGAARRARDLCAHFGVQMCIEDVWGSDITTAAALHLATATSPKHILNVCDLSGYVSPRLDAAAAVRQNGIIRVGDNSGLGVIPDDKILGAPIVVYQ